MMPSAVEDPPALQDALELLHKASRTPAKQRVVKVSSVVDVICRHAFQHGLDEDALRDVVQLASIKTHLDQTSVTTLIKNLYPARRVTDDIIVTIVGALGQGKGKPSPSTQDSFVKWLTTVHDILENPSTLSRLYGVLFGMLDMISIRTSLCHLLSFITRRKHVKPFRIQQILELSRGLGNEPALQGLLRVFKDYYPDIILGSTSTSRRSFAPQPDAEWRTRILVIQEASVDLDNATADHYNGFKVLRKGPKRSKVAVIPDVHTFHATEASTTLEGIDNVDDFVEKFDRIDPPGQLVSFLTDPLLQKYVDLRPSPIIASRIDLWLATCLEELYESERLGTGDQQSLGEVLDGLLQHAQCAKELPTTALAFLKEYVKIWGGLTHVNAILGLLTYIPMTSFQDTYAAFLQPVERTLASQGFVAIDNLLSFYAALLQRQACMTASRDTRLYRGAQPQFVNLAEHVITSTTSILLSMPSSEEGQNLLSSILFVYEQLALTSKPRIIPIVLPSMRLIYLLAQQDSPASFGRLCGIVATYKNAFDEHPRPVKDYYPTKVTDSLNWCLRDVYNLIWVSRGLMAVDQKATGFYCDVNLRSTLNDYLNGLEREYAIGNAFSLSNNPLLACLSSAAWRSIEEQEIRNKGYDRDSIQYHQGPVNQRSLEVLKKKGGVSIEWDGSNGYKVLVLDWLAERGISGIKDLMFATVSDLKGKV